MKWRGFSEGEVHMTVNAAIQKLKEDAAQVRGQGEHAEGRLSPFGFCCESLRGLRRCVWHVRLGPRRL